MFLSEQELSELTDLDRKSAQIEWLTNRGYKFDVSATGHPKVLRKYVERRLGLRDDDVMVNSTAVPNFAHLEML